MNEGKYQNKHHTLQALITCNEILFSLSVFVSSIFFSPDFIGETLIWVGDESWSTHEIHDNTLGGNEQMFGEREKNETSEA